MRTTQTLPSSVTRKRIAKRWRRLSPHPVHADRPASHLHHKAGVIGSGHAPEDQEFFERIAAAIGDAGIVLITGPANAKTELLNSISALPSVVQAATLTPAVLLSGTSKKQLDDGAK